MNELRHFHFRQWDLPCFNKASELFCIVVSYEYKTCIIESFQYYHQEILILLELLTTVSIKMFWLFASALSFLDC